MCLTMIASSALQCRQSRMQYTLPVSSLFGRRYVRQLLRAAVNACCKLMTSLLIRLAMAEWTS